MPSHRPLRLVGLLVATAATATVVFEGLRLATPPGFTWQPARLAHALANRDPVDAATLLLALAAWLVAGWLGLGVAAVLAAKLPGALGAAAARAAALITPRVIRRAVDLALGVTVLAGGTIGGPVLASAATAPPRPAATVVVPSLDRPAPSAGPATTRPATPQPSAAPAAPPGHPPAARPTLTAPPPPAPEPRSAPAADGEVVVVRPGDSLWTIAARRLTATGRPPTDAEIAAVWPRWYAANRAVIGADPDLIRPGQHLAAPTRDREEP